MAVADEPAFTVDVDQNQYLAPGQREVSALVTVTALEPAAEPRVAGWDGAADAAEVIIVDCSDAMGSKPGLMAEVRRAVAAAVDAISDGVGFAIVAGGDRAVSVYPPVGGLAVASPATRAAARAAATRLSAGGGTAMGQWLRRARDLFASSPARLRHAVLLTGSRNRQRPEELAAAVAACEGAFVCDCRGVGTDWEVSEVRKISTALLGTIDIVPDPAGLASELAAVVRTAMSQRVADVSLRLWTPQLATVGLVKQVSLDFRDLTDRRRPAGRQSGDYPTGAWAPGDSRDYQLSIEVVPAPPGQEKLAARVSMVAMSAAGEQVLGRGLVRAVWTDDAELTTGVSPRVAAYAGQAELARLIEAGLEARRRDDLDAAAVRLGQAVNAALQLGRTDTFRLLAEVVQVVNADAGEVRLRRDGDVAGATDMALDLLAARTSWPGQAAMAGPEPAGPVAGPDEVDIEPRRLVRALAEPRRLAGHVFISYARENSDRVDQLQAMLQDAGIPVWRDTADLWPGEDWRAKIRAAITGNALVFVACFSRASLARARSYQNEELTLAIDQLRMRNPDDPWLIPVRLDDCEIPDREIGGGRTLGSIQRADLFGDRAREAGQRLIAAISRILERQPDATR